MLNVDTSRPLRRPRELVELVDAVVAATHVDETDAIEWKTGIDLTAKAGFLHVVRAILGFANRLPHVATRAFGGCAYVIVGAEPGKVEGVAPLDPAQLDDKMTPYLGTAGPAWSPNWLSVDERSVLVVLVEPPKPGDPIWKLRKAIEGYESGRVFVRRQGKTQPASADELDALELRSQQRNDGLEVTVEWAGKPLVIGAFQLDAPSLDTWINREREILLSPLVPKPRPSPRPAHPAATYPVMGAAAELAADVLSPRLASLVSGENRTPERFRKEVDEYLAETREALEELVIGRAARTAARLELAVLNTTDRNFADVELIVWIRAQVFGIDRLRTGLPERPRGYGTAAQPFGADLLGSLRPPHFQPPPVPRPRIDNSNSVRIEFPVVDLRPHARVILDPIMLVAAADSVGGTANIEWTATAKNANGRPSGHLEASTAAQPMTTSELLPAHVVDGP